MQSLLTHLQQEEEEPLMMEMDDETWEEEPEEDPFWAFFEEKPDDIGEEEDNRLFGLLGIIAGHLASVASIIGLVSAAFTYGVSAVGV